MQDSSSLDIGESAAYQTILIVLPPQTYGLPRTDYKGNAMFEIINTLFRLRRNAAGPTADHINTVENGHVTVDCFPNQVPSFVETDIARLYGSLSSSIPYIRSCDSLKDARVSTYVASRNGEAICIILFKVQGEALYVINCEFDISMQEMSRFITYIFNSHRTINSIHFQSVSCPPMRITYPYQRVDCLDDIVVHLPNTVDDYTRSLGKSTRHNVRRNLRNMQRDCPSFATDIYEAGNIPTPLLHEIIRIKRDRMSSISRVSYIDEAAADRIVTLAKTYGLVCVLSSQGKIIAATINYRIGDDFFLDVITHDPSFESLRAGTACGYLSICESILRNGTRYHFLSGMNDYKFRLGGVLKKYQKSVFFRSRWHFLLNSKLLFENLIEHYRWEVWRYRRICVDQEIEKPGYVVRAIALTVRIRSAFSRLAKMITA